ncbi:Zinc finger GRF-type protein [Arachis hypogaea]|nr:Zinc finger GRF-type protein [Arachis hypogaea]
MKLSGFRIMSASGSQSSMRSNRRISRGTSRASSIPEWCGCGCRPVLRWSTTETNPNKPFFGCPNYNVSGKRLCGLFVWADIGEEDIGGRVTTTENVDELRVNLAWRIRKLEAEVRTHKLYMLLLALFIMFVAVFMLVFKV